MTEIRIDGDPVDISQNISIPLDLVNPHLSYESIPNSKANIPALPFSLRNQQIFQFAEMPQAGNELRQYECEQFYNGALIYRAPAYVKGADPIAGYELETGDDLGRFFGVYQNILLTELNLGTVAVPAVLTPLIQVAGQNAVCFPKILNADYYGTNGAALSYTGIVNEYAGSAYAASGPKVPQLFVKFVLSRIAALTGVSISGSFLQDPTWSQLLITNWRALDGANQVNVAHHLPAWTISQLLLELRKVPNLRMVFNTVQKTLSIDFWEEHFTIPPRVDWTDKAVPGHKKYNEYNRRLHLAFELDGGDSLLKDKPVELGDYQTPAVDALSGEAVTFAKVPLRLATFMLDQVTGLPIAKQTGVTKEFNQLAVTTSPRLLFWHGLQASVPKALPTLNGVSLYLTGATGIAARSWQKTEAMRREMFYLQKSFVLTETDLALLDWSRQIHYNGLNYMVAHIAGELPLVKPCSVLLIKV